MMRNSLPSVRSISLAIVMVAGSVFSGCGNGGAVISAKCHLVDGTISVQMKDNIRADSATAILATSGLPYDTTTVADSFLLYFEVIDGDPHDLLRPLLAATQAHVVGLDHDNLVYVLLRGDPSWGIRQGGSVPGLKFHHIWWYNIDTKIRVPVGTEESWISWFEDIPGVAFAERVQWCPV